LKFEPLPIPPPAIPTLRFVKTIETGKGSTDRWHETLAWVLRLPMSLSTWRCCWSTQCSVTFRRSLSSSADLIACNPHQHLSDVTDRKAMLTYAYTAHVRWVAGQSAAAFVWSISDGWRFAVSGIELIELAPSGRVSHDDVAASNRAWRHTTAVSRTHYSIIVPREIISSSLADQQQQQPDWAAQASSISHYWRFVLISQYRPSNAVLTNGRLT